VDHKAIIDPFVSSHFNWYFSQTLLREVEYRKLRSEKAAIQLSEIQARSDEPSIPLTMPEDDEQDYFSGEDYYTDPIKNDPIKESASKKDKKSSSSKKRTQSTSWI